MTHHSVHLFSMRHSYRYLTVQIDDGPPLSVAGHGTLCSDSFYVPDVSLVPDLTMQLMSARQITDHDCVSFLTLIFAIFWIVTQVTWLVLAPGVVTHIVFESLTGFVFLLLRLPVLLVLLSLLRPCRCFLSGIIVCIIFMVFNYLHCFVEVF
jgi:hypothetical protein